jgi:hypothetical protein
MCYNVVMESVKKLYCIAQVSSSKLAPLQAHAVILSKLDAQVRALLPKALRPYCRVANLRGDTLVLQVDAASWATHLRFYKNTLLANWPDCGFARPRQIHILVRAQVAPPVLPPLKRPCLSTSGAALLESTAAALDYAPLQAALRQLARNRSEA